LLFSESTIGVVFFTCGKDEKSAVFKKVLVRAPGWLCWLRRFYSLKTLRANISPIFFLSHDLAVRKIREILKAMLVV